MRSGPTSLLLPVLVALACGGTSGEPAPVTPAPVPEPVDLPSESAAESAAGAAAGASAGAPAPSPEEARMLEAIGRLGADPPVAFYLPGDGSALVGRTDDAVLVSVDGQSEAVAVKEEEARRLLARRLAGQQLVELAYTAWPGGARKLDLESPNLTVTWPKNGVLSARVGKKTIAIGRIESGGPDAPQPAGLFSSPQSPSVLIVVRGAASTEVLRFELAP